MELEGVSQNKSKEVGEMSLYSAMERVLILLID